LTNELVDMMNGAMAITVLEARRGYAAASVPLEGNGNHFGVVYAGVQFTVAELLAGSLPWRVSMRPSTFR
jgi:acyl-coenzyme A thioesterase PaaI-like protein